MSGERVVDPEPSVVREMAIERRVMDLEADLAKANARIKLLYRALHNLLLSSDAAWEEKGLGHDWPLACDDARAALRG